MSQAEVMLEETVLDGVVLVALAGLSSGSPYRQDGLCSEQVDRLTELGGSWPPILVSRDGVVIDGGHRVAAARRLGLARIPATYFEGAPEEAFVEFVRRNVTHGLVLSLWERKQAAARLLHLHRGWSDRRVAEVCALSPKTVGRLRVTLSPAAAPAGEDVVEVREGRDHRLRPVRRGSVRGKVVEALRAQPESSLRTIAALVGVSPETVRLVRMNLDAMPDAGGVAEDRAPSEASITETAAGADDGPGWASDSAITSAEGGGELVAWMERTQIGATDLSWAESIPLSRVYVIAEEARRRSELWLQLAHALEARPARAR